jgi:hypothetical protein
MKINFKKIAMISASALVIATYAGTASAQPVLQPAVDFDPGAPVTFDIWAEVANTITADITGPDMGAWGVIRSNVGGDNATLTLTPASTQTANVDGAARTIAGGSAPVAGTVDVTGAFPSTPVNVTLQTAVDLTCAACTVGNPPLQLIIVTAELTPPAVGTAGSDAVLDVLVPANNAVGQATTTVGGALNFRIGATAQTTVGAAAYESGSYEGAFDMIMEY